LFVLLLAIIETGYRWTGHLLFGEDGDVVVDAKLAEDLAEEIPVGEVCLEGVDHLASTELMRRTGGHLLGTTGHRG